jgi:membrane-bound lytic murein transglycosylase D
VEFRALTGHVRAIHVRAPGALNARGAFRAFPALGAVLLLMAGTSPTASACATAGACAAGGASSSAGNPFVRTPEIEPDVDFWKRVYTQVTTNDGLVHDDRRLGIVYEVLRFAPNLPRSDRQHRVEQVKAKYRAMLRRFGSGVEAATDEERRVRALWPQNTSAREFMDAADRVRFQLGQADRFREGLIRAGTYEAHIADTLKSMGLPAELSALPHVESSFDPTAYSKAGAAGLWQFMRSTGRRYMRIDATVDERMDPYRSTVAAAQLLKFNYDLLGTWPLAITAYNHGPSGMRRAKEKQGTDDIVTISRRHQSRTFGFASRNYYFAFLAALEVDREATRYFGPLTVRPEVQTRSFELPAYVPVSALQRSSGLSLQTLRELNPSLTSAVWSGERYVPKGFVLKLPATHPAAGDPRVLLASLTPGELFTAQKVDRTYRVRSGDTLSRIASATGTTVSALMRNNDLRKANQIRVGQVLQIPGAGATVGTGAAVAAGAAPSAGAVSAGAAASPPAPAPAPTVAKVEEKIPAGEVIITDLPPPPDAQPDEEPISELLVALAQKAEPVSETQAEETGPALLAGAEKITMTADPNDYTVADDGSIEVQATETLGHYAEWLGVRASKLRQLNRMRPGTPVVVGRRLKVDTSRVDAEEFTQRRRAYHQKLQEDFFAAHRIVGTEDRVVRPGESVWMIAQKYPNVPIWLLRQYNPDVDFATVRPGAKLELPLVEATEATAPPVMPQRTSGPIRRAASART